ncbi:MAG: hypothetical protein JWP27_3037 [Flaviaesturariibacter sp.]|nr:hypothetical protein [Flaviaesturariibacter sp.]
MTASVKEARARGEAEAAKARLTATLDELKARLAPATLASNAVQAAKDKSIVVADDTVSAVKDKPLLSAGIAAGTALFLARKPVFSAIGRLFSRNDHSNTISKSRRVRARETEDIDNGID